MKIVCISDTHNRHCREEWEVPDGDVLIYGGDFSRFGLLEDVDRINQFLSRWPHRHKLLIAGNHDFCFERPEERDEAKSRLTGATYLEDEAVEIDGVHFYGSPWQPRHGRWAFQLDRGEALREKWSLIPDNTDILITHGPPLGHGDAVQGDHKGCADLLARVEEIKPSYHIFGHIHQGRGITKNDHTTFINATCLAPDGESLLPPFTFDFEAPQKVNLL